MTTTAKGSGEAWPIGRRQMLTAIIASSLGWALDLFDLFILLYVAPVIGRLFFPSDIPRSRSPRSMHPLPSPC